MRHKRAVIITLLLALMLSFASAHPGRTDSKGGHAGSQPYHYHHGYPAHDHEDGICPYDFDDRTGWNSGSSSSSSKRKTTKNETVTVIPDEPEEVNKPFPWDTILICIFLSPLVFITLVSFVYWVIDKIKFKKERKKYMKLYANKEPVSLVDAPPGVTFDEETYPYNENDPGCYTVYISKSGNAYHRYACNAKATICKHIVEVDCDLHPCRRCKPTPPDLQWYKEYLKIVEIKKKYKIP